MRPSLDEFALSLADTAATRSEDPKHKVGAVVLAHDGRVLGIGYNGPPPGVDLTDEQWADRAFVRGTVVHAETNAMVGVNPHEAALLATTLGPCARCIGMAERLGIRTIVSRQDVPSSFIMYAQVAFEKFGTDFQIKPIKPVGPAVPRGPLAGDTFHGTFRPAHGVRTLDPATVKVGEILDASDFDSYQVGTRRTGGEVPTDFEQWRHMIGGFLLGLGGEAGEVLDIHKKDMYHGVDTTPAEIKLELGDVLFYLARIADMHDIRLSDVAASNTAKLLERYPDGFVNGGGNR